MNSVKTGVVVVVLLGVLFGVYKVLNVPKPSLTKEEQEALERAENMEIDPGTPIDAGAAKFGQTPVGQGSPVSSDPYATVAPTPLDTTQGSGAGSFDLTSGVPHLTAGDESSGSGTRTVYPSTQPEPKREFSPDLPEAAVTTSAASGSSGFQAENEIARDVALPTDFSAPENNTKDAGGSFYVNEGGQALEPTVGPSDTAGDDIAARAFDRALYEAEDLIAQGKHRDALAELTRFYDAPSLTPEEKQKLINWLDPLAGKVIYSSEHLLGQPHVVRSGENLSDIAYEYGVPAQLLYNINRSKINNPRVLLPGTELKVVRGPFEAYVSLRTGKLTLVLGELYAGHFPMTVGNDPAPQPGTYYVKQIAQGREYITRDGSRIPADNSANPYGRWWIDLGSEISIHGAAANGNSDGRGCISLSAIDIADLSEILSRDSKVRIEE